MIKRLLFLTFFASSLGLFAQKDIDSTNYAEGPFDPRMTYGINAGVGLNLHSADFKKFEGIESCCPGYESGSGIGPYAGIYLTIPLSQMMELYVKGSYTDLSGTLSREETTQVFSNNGSAQGVFEHRFKANLSLLAAQIGLNFKINDYLRLNAGLRSGTLMSKKLDEHIEEITAPNNGVFLDTKTRTRNSFTGDIPNASSLINSAILGASYDFPLNSAYTLFLVPEFNYSYTFSNYISDFSWNSMEFSGGIGLRWAPRAVKAPKPVLLPPPPPPLPAPPPPPVAPKIDATVMAYALNENGVEETITRIKIEENLENKTHPLLNYVFFDEAQSELPSRYKRISEREKRNFSFKNFYSMKTMDVYYNVLNIIGRRMQFYPQAKITLVGCNSDEKNEKGNLALSQKRAETVKNYLEKEWNVDSERIIIESRNLPENPSKGTELDGITENRRVEIIANFPQIFEPMVIYDTIKTTNIPSFEKLAKNQNPIFKFKTSVKSSIGIREWKLQTSQNGNNLKTFSGNGNPPAVIDWKISDEDEKKYLPKLDVPLEYQLLLVDNDGKQLVSKKQVIDVEVLSIEKKIFEMIEDNIVDRFSMIGFGFDKSDLNDRNKNIAEKIKKRIDRSSSVQVTGHTDRIGNDDYNLKLSERRAVSVAKSLNVIDKNAKGIGENVALYDNNLPEGRFYNRTVRIDITTPVE